MGRAWHDASVEAARVFARADEVLEAGDWIARFGRTLTDLCFNGPAETLNRTDVSQPAILTASVACWRGVGAAATSQGEPAGPAALVAAAGLSLGEYTALCLAGALSFDDALRLVALRGRAMQEAAEARPSGMVALIGADEAQAVELCTRALAAVGGGGHAGGTPAGGGEVLVPANFNAPGQIVISGTAAACEAAERLAGDLSLRATRLAVAGAFHSPVMAPAAARLAAALEQTQVHAPRCPVLSNVTGLPHEADPASIRRRLVEQLTMPVRWEACCRWLAAHHVTPRPETTVCELAPGKTLSGLMRRIDKALKVHSHDSPAVPA